MPSENEKLGEKTIFTRAELLELIGFAKNRIRILGAVAFALPYNKYMDDWYVKINEGKLKIEIICESEPNINYCTLLSSDKRASGEKRSWDMGHFLNIKNEPEKKLRNSFLRKGCKHLEPEDSEQCLSIRTCYLSIPIPVINIDDDYYITLSLTKFSEQEKFEKVTAEHTWFKEFKNYFFSYFDSDFGAKKFSTEISEKGDRAEVILMYNEKRQVIGQAPRDSFLGSTKVKVVVWGILFTRDGKILIHQRGKNAKDNQGMWDKSIGGHVDINDIDTAKAAARESAEELYKVEAQGQGQHGRAEMMEANENKPNFLGEWRSDMRYVFPFREVQMNSDEVFFFRMDYNLSKTAIDSPRILPEGNKQPVKVFADLFVFIMPSGFKVDDTLQNSKYQLLEMHELKDSFHDGKISILGQDGKSELIDFKVTPDLEKIITSTNLWEEELSSFASYLKDQTNEV
jgi:isopentenyldiphosphate isomerase